MRGLRQHMALTQEQLAEALGVRQQTVSEWETGQYQPRGASERLLSIVADDAGYQYGQPVQNVHRSHRGGAEGAEGDEGAAPKRGAGKRSSSS